MMQSKNYFFINFEEADAVLVVEKFLRRFDVLDGEGVFLESNAGLETRRDTFETDDVLGLILSDNCFVGLFSDKLLVERPIPETARRTNETLDKDERPSNVFSAADEFNRFDDAKLDLATFIVVPPILARRTTDADFVTVRSAHRKKENVIEMFLIEMYEN